MFQPYLILYKIFEADCDRERENLKLLSKSLNDKGIIPMYFPTDTERMSGILEIAEKGGPKNAEHTLRNVNSFSRWEKPLITLRVKSSISQISTIRLSR